MSVPGGPVPAGSTLAGRYRVGRALGIGGQGAVFAATDEITGQSVALKLLHPLTDDGESRLRREVATLRTLCIPGVVRLLDEGRIDDRRFLVTEYLEGAPFPGTRAPADWREVVEMGARILDTLAVVHAAGIIHRDLKPANVLVLDGDRPVLLDFGLARRAHVDDAITQGDVLMGTPAYLAPEQITSGAHPTQACDLYACGLMLFEALTGVHPFSTAADMRLFARTLRAAPSLRSLRPDLPDHVVHTIDDLLARRPEARPRSARAAAVALRASATVSASDDFPFLGRRRERARVDATLTAGEAVLLVGPAEVGKSALCRRLVNELRAAGQDVVLTLPTRTPLRSLLRFVDAAAGDRATSLADMLGRTREAVQAFLAGGGVVVVDDLMAIDEYSRRILLDPALTGRRVAAAREAPPLAPTWTTVTLDPLTPEDLEPLFVGQQALFRVPPRAAAELHARTGGHPVAVRAEAERWVAHHDAEWTGDRLAVQPEALDRLRMRLGPPVLPSLDPEPNDSEILSVLGLSRQPVDLDLLTSVTGWPRWQVEAEVEHLVETRRALRTGDGQVAPADVGRIPENIEPARRIQLHLRLARDLPPGEPSRLAHLVAGGATQQIPAEAAAVAEAALGHGRADVARFAVMEGVAAARHLALECPGAALDALCLLVTRLATDSGGVSAIDAARWELGRLPESEVRTACQATLEALTRSRAADGASAVEILGAVAVSHVPALARICRGGRVVAARRCSVEVERAVVAEGVEWAAGAGSPEARAAASVWLGRLAYREARYVDAAGHQLDAARSSPWPLEALGARTSAAAALLELGRLEDARQEARVCSVLAAEAEHPYHEARALWVERSAAYRACEAVAPDAELLAAVQTLTNSDLTAAVALTEAAIAWRAGMHQAAQAAARIAAHEWRQAGKPRALALALALDALCGGPPLQPADVPPFDPAALPRLGVQAAALAMMAGARLPAATRAAMRAQLAAFEALPELRWEVLSPLEVQQALESPTWQE